MMERGGSNGQEQNRNRGSKESARTIPAQTPMSGIGLWGIIQDWISGAQRM